MPLSYIRVMLLSIYQSHPFLLPIVVIGLAVLCVRSIFKYGSRHPLLPPGPDVVPIIGNLNVLPREDLHLTFMEWSQKYGDVISVKVMNQTIIVLSSPTSVRNLFSKRSNSCSSRPKSIISDMLTDCLNMGSRHRADDTWKTLRKASSYLLNASSMKKYRGFQYAEASQFMWEVLHAPEGWYGHCQRYTTSYFLGVLYGKRAPRSNSKDVQDFLKMQRDFMHVHEMGTLPPVDLFPILQYLPKLFAKWKQTIRDIRNFQQDLNSRLLASVESRMANGYTCDAFMEDAIKNADAWGLDNRDLLANLAGTLLQGADNSSAAIQYILLCIAAFPEARKKAQAEIDQVIGADRAPLWDDARKLPYVMAFVNEVQRFRPVANLGLPREMDQDEIVDGYLYPKGAAVFQNSWMIFHDERYFHQPYDFVPERFLEHPLGIKEGVRDDPARNDTTIFGAGRRVCPGVLFARSTSELLAMHLLWGFDILPALDEFGNEILPDLNNKAKGFTSTPVASKICIKPRSSRHAEIINKLFLYSSDTLRHFEIGMSEEEQKYLSKCRSTL